MLRPALIMAAVRTLEVLLLLPVDLLTLVMIDSHAILGLWRVILNRK